MVGQIIEFTFIILIFGLILAHASAFSSATSAVASLYQGSVKTLSQVANP